MARARTSISSSSSIWKRHALVPSCRRYKRVSAAAYVSASRREHTDRENDRTLKRNASVDAMEAFVSSGQYVLTVCSGTVTRQTHLLLRASSAAERSARPVCGARRADRK